MKIGFVGAGNLATAIIKGICKSAGNYSLAVFDILSEKSEQLGKTYGVEVFKTAKDLASECDVVILIVKPKDFPAVCAEIGETLREKNPLVMSTAAGTQLTYIQSLLPYEAALVRLMPNMNAAVGESATAYCTTELVTESQRSFVEEFCSCFGKVFAVDEKLFSVFGVIGGCAPAFAFMFIDQLARAAVKHGMNKQLALDIAAQTVLGSASSILGSDLHPYELIDRVCSPGGTTIEGIAALQEFGFENAVNQAVIKAYEKDCAMRAKH